MSITFFNFKGGVGKSSLAIAYALSRELPLVTLCRFTRKAIRSILFQ